MFQVVIYDLFRWITFKVCKRLLQMNKNRWKFSKAGSLSQITGFAGDFQAEFSPHFSVYVTFRLLRFFVESVVTLNKLYELFMQYSVSRIGCGIDTVYTRHPLRCVVALRCDGWRFGFNSHWDDENHIVNAKKRCSEFRCKTKRSCGENWPGAAVHLFGLHRLLTVLLPLVTMRYWFFLSSCTSSILSRTVVSGVYFSGWSLTDGLSCCCMCKCSPIDVRKSNL